MASKLKVPRGTTFAITVNYKRNGAAASLVGATVRFTVKSSEWDTSATDSTALITKNVTSHTDAANGISTITITPADTDDVTPGNYYYDIKVDEDSDGVTVYKIDEGRFVLDGSPTNRLA